MWHRMWHRFARLIICTLFIATLAACGGGGGGGEGNDSGKIEPPIGDISGTWTVTETGKNDNCPESPLDTYFLDVTQTGGDISVVDDDGNTYQSSLSGNRFSWLGSYQYNGGTVTIDSMNVAIDTSCNSLSGSANWSWSGSINGSQFTCNGTTQLSGSRSPAIGCGSAPAAPGNLNATATSEASIQLSWQDNAGNEAGFRIFRSQDQTSGFSRVAEVNSNVLTYSDTGLTASTTYYYYVVSYNNAGQSDASNTADATTPGNATVVPATPSNFRVSSISHDAVALAWDDAAIETGYRLERSLDGTSYAEVATLAADATVYTDNQDIQGSTTYYYRLFAVNSAGDSSPAETNGATPSLPAPQAPDGLTATTASQLRIDLSWSDSSDNEAGFKIERRQSGSSDFSEIATVPTDVETFENTGLSSATTYYYRVRAYNTAGDSDYSQVASATTQAPTLSAPPAPTNVSASNISSNSALISWTDEAGSEDGYEVGTCSGLEEVGSDGSRSCTPFGAGGFDMVAQLPADMTSYTWSDLSAGTTHTLYVRAYNQAGTSPNRGVQFTTEPLSPEPAVLRLVNDLDHRLDWSQWNTIIRVRIGSTENAVLTNTGLERLWPSDFAASNETEHYAEVISPALDQVTSYKEFDVSGFSTGTYWVYMQTGWWDYNAFDDYWAKHMTQVFNCDGVTTTYKWATFRVTDHTSGTLTVNASEFLPHYGWNETSFCP